MQKEIKFLIDFDVYEKLQIALHLSGDDESIMLENCIKSYIAKVFGAVSQEFTSANTVKQFTDDKSYYGKAIQRIPLWSLKPNQYNHKIIKAFFEIEKKVGKVSLTEMEQICSNKECSELYVPTFRNNYAQMKIDGPKSHGKVFEDDGEHVWIWKEVETELRKYQDAFLE